MFGEICAWLDGQWRFSSPHQQMWSCRPISSPFLLNNTPGGWTLSACTMARKAVLSLYPSTSHPFFSEKGETAKAGSYPNGSRISIGAKYLQIMHKLVALVMNTRNGPGTEQSGEVWMVVVLLQREKERKCEGMVEWSRGTG